VLELNATAFWQISYIDIPIIPNTSYSFIKGNGDGLYYVKWLDSSRQEFFSWNGGAPVNSFTEVAPNNAAFIRVEASNGSSGTGLRTFTNPMLNIGSTALPFEPFEEDYLFLETKLHSSVDGSVYDELIPTKTGYEKFSKIKEIVLDGSLAWEMSSGSSSGFKEVRIPEGALYGSNRVYASATGIKYDGKIMYNAISAASDTMHIGSTHFYLRIPNTDSGWGDSYTPTAQEIQAYFYGWKMNNGTFGTPYNGTGTKTWIPWSATSNTGAVITVPTTPSSDITNKVFDYYKLVYQLSAPVREPVRYEGGISLREGQNIVEIGSGVIVREKVNPVYNSGFYYVNRTTVAGSNLKNRAAKILKVYRNGTEDNKWVWIADSTAYGTERITLTEADYDPTAVYEVTYLVLDKYLFTSNPVDLLGSYEPNLNKAVDSLINRQTNAETKISILEKGMREVFQSGVDGKAKLETAIIAKNGTVSKQGQIATFDELDAGIRSISGSSIKSVQAGTTTISGSSTSVNVTISQVDLSKSIVIISGLEGYPSSITVQQLLVAAEILNQTTLRISRSAGGGSDTIIVPWQVIEFENIKSLQKGVSSTASTNISNTNLSKSVLFFSYKSTNTSTTLPYGFISARLMTIPTRIALSSPTSINNYSVYWQVVEFN
jgi:hypothetical protein